MVIDVNRESDVGLLAGVGPGGAVKFPLFQVRWSGKARRRCVRDPPRDHGDCALADCGSFTDTAPVDLLVTDPVTGRTTGLTKTIRRALKAMEAARIPYCVIGATALAVRGLPRMTGDLDVVVLAGNAARAIAALRSEATLMDAAVPEAWGAQGGLGGIASSFLFRAAPRCPQEPSSRPASR